MELPKSAVTALASEGYHTLQVPQYSISFNGAAPDPTEIVDDEHIVEVKCFGSSAKQRICTGREYGFTYLSRKGWQHYFHDLKAAFNPNRGTWAEFVNAANETLDEIETLSRKELLKLQALNTVDPTPYRIKKAQDLAVYLKRM